MDIQRSDTGKRRRRGVVAASAGGVGFLLLLVLGFSLANRPPAVDGGSLWSAAVSRGELVHEISAAGTLIAPELRAVTNRSEGVVERIFVLPGASVEPQDVLLEMSSPQLEEDLVNARWDLDAEEAQAILSGVEIENRYLDIVATLATAEAEYTTALLELEAQEELGRSNISSAIEVERSRQRTQSGLKRVEAEQARLDRFDEYRSAQEGSTRARISQMRERVQRLEGRVADLRVRAGITGVVQEVNAQEGERLNAGEAVARIVNPAHLIARIGVSERDASLVEEGLPVRIEVGRDVVAGEVTRVDPTVRDRLVTVDVALTSKPATPLRPDLSVTARIELQRVSEALILDRPVGIRGGAETVQLFRLSRDGSTAERVSVEIGRASARQVEIVSGLDAGDRVILADLSDWLSEERIRIR